MKKRFIVNKEDKVHNPEVVNNKDTNVFTIADAIREGVADGFMEYVKEVLWTVDLDKVKEGSKKLYKKFIQK